MRSPGHREKQFRITRRMQKFSIKKKIFRGKFILVEKKSSKIFENRKKTKFYNVDPIVKISDFRISRKKTPTFRAFSIFLNFEYFSSCFSNKISLTLYRCSFHPGTPKIILRTRFNETKDAINNFITPSNGTAIHEISSRFHYMSCNV